MYLFPTLHGRPCGYVNLNELAKRVRAGCTRDDNPFIDPDRCHRILLEYHEASGIAYSYGGYLEKRSTLWEGVKYLRDNKTFLHLGVDFNVQAGTPVAINHKGVVELIDTDFPEKFGWGTRVIVKLTTHPLYVIYVHLDPQVSCRVGQVLMPNSYIGRVGVPPQNGGWFPHLHVQLVTTHAWRYYKNKLKILDGYGKEEELIALSKMFPDPLPYLRVW